MRHCLMCKKNIRGKSAHNFCSAACRSSWAITTKSGMEQPESRIVWMAAMYRQGKTLQEIGDHYGITRERVRQLIGKLGLKGKDGGLHYKAVANEVSKARERAEERRQKFILQWGCTREEFEALNEGKKASDQRGRLLKWRRQKMNADNRGIPFELSFTEWCRIWDDSGKWPLHGRGVGKFCMSRIMDTGPYAVGNVQIREFGQNIRDYQASLKERGVVGEDGYKRLPENPALIKPRFVKILGGECKFGHAFDERNVVMISDTYRICRTCRKQRWKEAAAARKARGFANSANQEETAQ